MQRLFLFSLFLLMALIAPFAAQPAPQPALARSTQAQPDPLFGLLLNADPGPATWLLGQVYGNSTGAFAQRREWYQAGQAYK